MLFKKFVGRSKRKVHWFAVVKFSAQIENLCADWFWANQSF